MQISYSSELHHSVTSYGASQVALVVKNLCANVREDVRDTGSISGSGRSPRGGHGNPLQYPRESHGPRSLEGYSSRGLQRVRQTEAI